MVKETKLSEMNNVNSMLDLFKSGCDGERVRDPDKSKWYKLIDGYKTSGVHSSKIVEALESMGMDDIDIIDNNRFLWEATKEEQKTWLTAEAHEVFFMLKPKRGKRYNELKEVATYAKTMQMFPGITMEEVLAGVATYPHHGCCGHH
ncbi:MAG: hypothetical protein Q9166_003667 [cf. Caloplaca sp. 2 TL-2023]